MYLHFLNADTWVSYTMATDHVIKSKHGFPFFSFPPTNKGL